MAFLLCVALLFPVRARGATVVARSDAELAAISDRVVRGRVIDTRVEELTDGVILTVTRVAVLEDLTGNAGPVVEVRDLGGQIGDRVMWVPGAPRFTAGQEVVLCLEAWRGGYRSVAMGYSAFYVDRAALAEPVLRRSADVMAVGRAGAGAQQPVRGLAQFRQAVRAARGLAPVTPVLPRELADAVAAMAPGPVDEPFTLLGDGMRWHQADTDTPVVWYRNPDYPSPLTSGNVDQEIQVALAAWTNPATARISLSFGGTRSDAGAAAAGQFCTAANAGLGIITFDDPGDYMSGGTLAVGGGCANNPVITVNGTNFYAFSHGFVWFNELSGSFTVAPNFTRVMTHEIGHGIGLGHSTDLGAIMYPSCCAGSMPVPPAIGADDLAGIQFIYPMPAAPPACTFTIAPTSASYEAGGGSATVAVTASAPNCTWTAASSTPWVTITAGATGTGSGTVGYAVDDNSGAVRTGTLTIANATFTVTQGQRIDSDSDTLPDWWELAFGLDPTPGTGATGDNGPAGDPDGDGISNADEYARGTHPRGFYTRYLAEGAVNSFFQTEIAIVNPEAATARINLRVQPEALPERSLPLRVEPFRRLTMDNSTLLGLTDGAFSAAIESDRPVVVDRTMSWDQGGYGAHAESAVLAPSATWYLAEGATAGDFSLFYLLQNPGPTPVTATVRYLRPAPFPPIVRNYPLPPTSRVTIPVDEIEGLEQTEVSAVISAQAPIIVERAMYLSPQGQPFLAGHDSAGVTAPSLTWFFAEGATGPFFELFLLLANPNTTAAQVTVEYLLQGGNNAVISKNYTVPANSRFTIWVDDEQFPARPGARLLADASVSMRVVSSNGVPIIAERAMWWPQPAWYEAHNAPGATTTGTRWALAGGEVGGARGAETYVLLANPTAVEGQASVKLIFENSAPLATTVRLPPHSRTNVPVSTLFPAAVNRRFGVDVQSTGNPAAQIVVERATYWNTPGVTWSAGVSELATRLSP